MNANLPWSCATHRRS